jgi:cobalamin biosynthesis Mg chelatase CobN
MLQDITEEEEYKVKSGTSITVVDAGEREQMDAENGSPTDTSNNNEEQNTSKETEYKVIENSVRKEEKAKADNRVVIVSAVLGSLLFLTIAGIVVYCIVKKNEKPDPAEKYTVARRESL